MPIQINAVARIQYIKAAAPGDLYSKFVKVLGKETRKKESRGGTTQKVEWILGHTRNRSISFTIEYYPTHDAFRLDYDGIADSIGVVGGKGVEEKKVLALFKKEANKWLASGEATPEDREYLEHIMQVK